MLRKCRARFVQGSLTRRRRPRTDAGYGDGEIVPILVLFEQPASVPTGAGVKNELERRKDEANPFIWEDYRLLYHIPQKHWRRWFLTSHPLLL